MKILITLTFLTLFAKAQDSTNSVYLPLNIDSLVSVFEDIRINTFYYTFDCKETTNTYNTPLVAYYRGTRKKIFIVD